MCIKTASFDLISREPCPRSSFFGFITYDEIHKSPALYVVLNFLSRFQPKRKGEGRSLEWTNRRTTRSATATQYVARTVVS